MMSEDVDIDRFLDRHRDRFRRLISAIVAEEEGEDPFRVPLDRYLALPEDERVTLVRRATAIVWERVQRELACRGAAWLVLVGDEVVAASDDAAAVPEFADLLELGKARALVPYLFTADLIEELEPVSAWAPLRRTDRYPTLPLAVHSGAAGPTSIVADLDTGAHTTVIDLDLAHESPVFWMSGRHLGRPFLWIPARIDIELRTTNNDRLRRTLAVWKVRDWPQSPFVRINPQRRVLAGRDLLRAFGLTLVLRAAEGQTEIAEGEPHTPG